MFDKTDFVQSENMSSNRERKASMSFYMLSKTYQVWTGLLNKIFVSFQFLNAVNMQIAKCISHVE